MKKKFVFFCIIALILTSIFLFTKSNSKELGTVTDYTPNVPMVKLYSGGYENSGYVEKVDYVSKDKIQLKHLSGAMAGVSVYSISKDKILVSYRTEEDLAGDRQQELDENYIDLSSNSQETILKGPIKKGTAWTDAVDHGTNAYEITGVDVKVNTPAGDFTAIEVTYSSTDSTIQVKNYYAKGLGLVKVAIEDYYAMVLSSVFYDFDEVKDMSTYDTLQHFLR